MTDQSKAELSFVAGAFGLLSLASSSHCLHLLNSLLYLSSYPVRSVIPALSPFLLSYIFYYTLSVLASYLGHRDTLKHHQAIKMPKISCLEKASSKLVQKEVSDGISIRYL